MSDETCQYHLVICTRVPVIMIHMIQASHPQTRKWLNNNIFFSFGRVERNTTIAKTKEPGPGSYNILDTVGVIQGYNVEEKIPRSVYLEQKALTSEQKMEKKKESTLKLKERMTRQDRHH